MIASTCWRFRLLKRMMRRLRMRMLRFWLRLSRRLVSTPRRAGPRLPSIAKNSRNCEQGSPSTLRLR